CQFTFVDNRCGSRARMDICVLSSTSGQSSLASPLGGLVVEPLAAHGRLSQGLCYYEYLPAPNARPRPSQASVCRLSVITREPCFRKRVSSGQRSQAAL